MGYELRRWLADRLPSSLSSGERLVALEIADQANEKTREAYGRDLLAIVTRRTGLADAKQVGKILAKLSANGIELRVPIRGKDGQPITDKAGRLLFACKGHELTFRIPLEKNCPALKVPQGGDLQSSPEQGTNERKGPPSGAQRSPARGSKVPPAGDPSPHIPSVPSSLSSQPSQEPPASPEERENPATPKNDKHLTAAQRAVRATTNITQAEEPAFITWITAQHQPRSPAWWRTAAPDLPELAATWRAQHTPAPAAPKLRAVHQPCACCGQQRPAATTIGRHAYCATCTSPCTTCDSTVPTDQLHHGQCLTCLPIQQRTRAA